jgi:hypothetical protein
MDPVTTPIGTMWIEEGVLWHRLDAGAVVGATEAREVMEIQRRLTGGDRVPTVIDVRDLAFADRDARDIFASPEQAEPEIATAIIVRNATIAERLVGLFVRHSRPTRPIEVFSSEDQARAWARGFVGDPDPN